MILFRDENDGKPKEVRFLRDLPHLFHVALQVKRLHVDGKTESLKEIFHLLRHLYGFVLTDEQFLEEFLKIREETFFNDGW